MVGPLEAGAIGGLAARGLHNFIDFNLEFPAVALPALVALAVVLPASLRKGRSSERRTAFRVGALAAGAVAIALAASPLGRTSKVEAAELDADIDQPLEKISGTALVERALKMTERHPSDYVGFGLAARALFRKGDSRAVELINRALDLSPEHSGVHWMAGQMLASTTEHRNQALVEYSLALRTAPEPRAMLAEMLARFPSTELAVRALPPDPDLAEKITTELATLKREDVALAYVEKMHKAIRDNHELAGLVADFALIKGQNQLALRTAKQAYDKDRGARNAIRWGRALVAVGRAEEAEAMIDTAIMGIRSRGTRKELVTILTLRGDVQRERKKFYEAKETLTSALDLASDRKDAAAIYRALARVEDASGNPNSAAIERLRAEKLDPGGEVVVDTSPPLPWTGGDAPTTGTASGLPPLPWTGGEAPTTGTASGLAPGVLPMSTTPSTTPSTPPSTTPSTQPTTPAKEPVIPPLPTP
jgi:tetratricopeptide (TPR) repeat protein